VEAGGLRLTLARDDLEQPRSAGAPPAHPATDEHSRLPELEARSEVDLRGLRVDEVGGPLLAAVDAAVVADLGRLLVIHGKGTGALRKEVERLLAEDPRVVSVRAGSFDEGGSGVTVLGLKGGVT
jgi:DNA mismatch repair protein MutS2